MTERVFTAAYSEAIQLRDGMAIVLRLVRPDDKDLLRAGFAQLSPESRYARFFAPKTTLSDDELRYLCEIDQESHFALGATREGDGGAPVGVGVARFIKLADAPGVAEAAITVADTAQGRGLGKLLFLRLCAAATERGVDRFRCEVLGSNTSMQHLLAAISPDHEIGVSQGVLTIELAVPAVSPTDSISAPAPESPMYQLFRAAAENTVDWTDAIARLWGRGRTSRAP